MDVTQEHHLSGDEGEFEVFVFPSGGKGIEVKCRLNETLRQVLLRSGVTGGDDVAAFLPRDSHGYEHDEIDEAEHVGDALDKTLRELGIGRGGRIVHSRCRWVEVTANYQNESPERRFRPSARVGRVLRWVTKKLNLKEEDYDVIKLKLCGGPDVRNDVRLAELLKPDVCSICFELILTPRVQGSVRVEQ